MRGATYIFAEVGLGLLLAGLAVLSLAGAPGWVFNVVFAVLAASFVAVAVTARLFPLLSILFLCAAPAALSLKALIAGELAWAALAYGGGLLIFAGHLFLSLRFGPKFGKGAAETAGASMEPLTGVRRDRTP